MKSLLSTFVLPLVLSGLVPDEAKFAAVDGWLQAASAMETIGPAHGDVAVSSAGEVYVSVLSGPRAGIQVFSADGKYLPQRARRADRFSWLCHSSRAGRRVHLRCTARAGNRSSRCNSTASRAHDRRLDDSGVVCEQGERRKPALRLTAVDVAPDGRIFAVDGYASDYIHIFDADGKYLKSFGGKAAPYGFKTNHKICIDTRFDPPRILCCDRENRRLVTLSIDGEVLGVVPDLKRPAAVAVYGDWAGVAEIEGRVSLIDKEGKIVRSLGENSVAEQTATNKVEPKRLAHRHLHRPARHCLRQRGQHLRDRIQPVRPRAAV